MNTSENGTATNVVYLADYLQAKELTLGSKWDCGHYRSVGACLELRYDEENAHRQCVKCNRYLSGNAVEYRAGLLHRIGPDRLARVEGPNAPVNYSVADLQELVKKFKDKTQALKRARGDYE